MKRTTGHIFQRGKSGTWYIQYQSEGKKRTLRLLNPDGTGCLNKKQAQASATRHLTRINEEDKAERARILMADFRDAKAAARDAELAELNSLGTFANGWGMFMQCPTRPKCCRGLSGADEPPAHTNARNYWGYWHHFCEWCQDHGKKLIADVSAADAIDYMDVLNCSTGTFNKQRMFLTMFYSVLIAEGKISCPNPFERIQPRDGDSNSKEPLSREQVASLLDAASGETKVLFALGYFTGLRLGDCCTLKWSEVDMQNGVINRLPRKTGRRVKDKSQAVVKVGIAPFLANMLECSNQEGEYVLPETAALYLGDKQFVITERIGAVFKKAGISMREEGTGGSYKYEDGKTKYIRGKRRAIVRYGFHSLRYSYISHNAEAGTPMGIIQRNAGHSSRMMTEHYLKISDEAARQYADALKLPEKKEGIADSQEVIGTISNALRERLLELCRQIPDDRLEQAIALLEDCCIDRDASGDEPAQ
ncbi:MAG: site-specific integrase [Victivallales bacterium]|nr:site-specific integrase [Victivallales bacterium]